MRSPSFLILFYHLFHNRVDMFPLFAPVLVIQSGSNTLQWKCWPTWGIIFQDRAFTTKVLLKLFELHDDKWKKEKYSAQVHILSTCMFLQISFLGGMYNFRLMWRDWLIYTMI
jgi:hypothetical protein